MRGFIALCVIFFILQMSVSAKNEKVIIENSNVNIIENNYSDIHVRVTKTTQKDVTTEIYAGLLSEYDDGRWSNMDFSGVDSVIIFDWESSYSICIELVEESNSEELSSNQTYSTSVMDTNKNMIPVSSDLSIKSQIKINGVNVGEKGLRIIDNANMSCMFSISNNSDSEKTLTALLVTYNESGGMQKARTVSVDVTAYDTENVQLFYQFDAENEYTGKLMLWGSVTNMKPLRTTVNFNQTGGVNAYYYDSDNRLLQIDKMNGVSLMYTYDNMGNLLTRTVRE